MLVFSNLYHRYLVDVNVLGESVVTFYEVLADIEKLVGMKLNSIRPGAEVTIKGIDKKKQRIILETSMGKIVTRPFSHIQRVWEALVKQPAVFVEHVLNGAGPSRNQPETILANLPYIEWLKLGKNKHIALVEKPTHKLGTLRQMDAIDVENLIRRMDEDWVRVKLPTAVVVASDISQTARNIESVTGLAVKSLEAGVYTHNYKDVRMLLVPRSVLPDCVMPGTYLVVKNGTIPFMGESVVVSVAGNEYRVLSEGDIKLFIFLGSVE
jgi:hypothetical protein